MWELADPIANCSDHICSKCWLLEELRLRVDELESELQTLWHVREGDQYVDALFRSWSYLIGKVLQIQSVIRNSRVILNSGVEEPQLLTLSN
eukprot:g11924.t1